MIRNLVLLGILLLVGLGPALAQDIFIKKESPEAAENGSKPTIYNKPTAKKFVKKQSSSIKYSDKLKVHNQKLKSAEMMRTLEYWRENDAKPSNAQEILMYAQANRSIAQNLMYKRREALIKHLEKEERKLQAKLAKRTDSAFKVKEAQQDKKESVSKVSIDTEDKPAKKKKPRLFVSKEKSAEEKAKPTKVFTNFR